MAIRKRGETQTQTQTEAAKPHPRETTGRPPTMADFSSEGRARAEAAFTNIASNPHTMAMNAAANATARVAGAKGGDADNVASEKRRAEQMTTAASLLTNSPTPVTMDVAAARVADNYARAGQRTLTGNIGVTDAALGPSSLAPSALSSVAHVKEGRGTVIPAGADWYQGHGGELARVAEATGADTRQTVVGSTSMSPQNDPVSERAAATAISYGQHGRGDRSLTMLNAPRGADDKTRKAHVQAMEDLDMRPGENRDFSDFTPDQVAKLARHRDHLTGNVDLKGIAKGGTEVATGTEMLRGQKTQADQGPTGKVPTYTHQSLLGAGLASMGEDAPDANDVAEFNRRVHESIPENHAYFEQPTLFGPEWEADPYGKAHVTQGILNTGHQPDVPHRPSVAAEQFFPEQSARHNAKLDADAKLHEGTTAQDTWAMAQSLALPRDVEGKEVGQSARSPSLVAKLLGSDEHVMNIGSGDKYMPTPKGERKLSKEEALHAMSNEINNRAAGIATDRARAAGRNVGAGVPAVAVQGGSWTSYRMDMDKDPDLKRREAHIAAQTAGRPNAPAGKTPHPGENVPLFDVDTGEATRYASNWRALPAKADKNLGAGPLFPQKTPADHANDHAASVELRGRMAQSSARIAAKNAPGDARLAAIREVSPAPNISSWDTTERPDTKRRPSRAAASVELRQRSKRNDATYAQNPRFAR